MIEKYIESDCLVFHDYAEATEVQQILLQNGYCVMMSREEELFILNWVWSETCSNRNDVIFINRGNYEYEWDAFVRHHPEIDWSKEDEV